MNNSAYPPVPGQDDQMQKLEVVLACRNLRDADVFSKSDPRAILKMKNPQTNQWYEVGRTETIQNNLNPNFKRSFAINYHFESKQEVYVEVQDDDGGNQFDHLGECFTTVGAIVGAHNNTLILDLTDAKTKKKVGKSKIIFIADKVSECNDFLFTQWRGIKLMNTDGWFDKSDPFLRFKRIRDDKSTILAHETEVIMDNLNPVWKPIELSCSKLNNGDPYRPVKVECWDWEKNEKFQYIGEFEFTVDELNNGKREFILKNPKHKNPGKIALTQFQYIQKPSFLQYIRGNTQLNFILAVDFTASNGAVSTPESLHYSSPNLMNQYQQAIVGIGEILLDYDTDKRVPCYGFGGVPRFPGLTFGNAQHCFPMSGNPANTEACGIHEIMNLYSYSLQHVSLSGPTYFNPILQETMKIAQGCKQEGSDVYSILMILTDGEIHDMNQTIDSLVYAADLPLSVIIVGIGNADFGNMERLDGDVQGLINSQGKKSTRDIVQFVPFRNVKGNLRQLASEVLFEIPQQLVSYMTHQGIKPKPAPDVSASQVNFQAPPGVAMQNFAQGMQGFLAPHIQNAYQVPPNAPPPPPPNDSGEFGGAPGGAGGAQYPQVNQYNNNNNAQMFTQQQQQQQYQQQSSYPQVQLQAASMQLNPNQPQQQQQYPMYNTMNMGGQSPQQQQQWAGGNQNQQYPGQQPAYPEYGFSMAKSEYQPTGQSNPNAQQNKPMLNFLMKPKQN